MLFRSEIGEKIAEAVEKSKPKTPEERMEDLVEEVTGTVGSFQSTSVYLGLKLCSQSHNIKRNLHSQAF